MLRLTTQRVRLCVFRHQETYREEDLWDVFSVELKARPGEGLGLTTVGKWYAYHAKKKKKNQHSRTCITIFKFTGSWNFSCSTALHPQVREDCKI